MKKRLFRSNTDMMIGGVCGGLGEYLGIDPTIIRIFFVLLALANGAGAWIYLLLWLVLPRAGQSESTTWEENMRVASGEIRERARSLGTALRSALSSDSSHATAIVGAVLIAAGALFLLRNLDIRWLRWLRWLNLGTLWPLLLVAAGVALLVRRVRRE